MTADVGLRAAKKQRTREHIAAVATRLFVVQGFESTTIAQIAREADVAKMTVTNYFPVKEDLLFDRAPELVPLLADAVAARPAGTSVLTALRDVYRRRLDERWPALSIVGIEFGRLVASSPALRARERQILAEQEEALAQVLIAEGDSTDPTDIARARILAARLAGVFRVLFDEARRRVLVGEDVETVVAGMEHTSHVLFEDAGAALQPVGPDTRRR